MVGGVRHGEHFTFVTADARLLTWDGGQLAQAPLPVKLQPIGLWRVGAKGLLVVDNRRRLLISQGAGEPWIDHQAAMVRTPRLDVSVASEAGGAYLALGGKGLPSDLLYLREGAAAPEPVPGPRAIRTTRPRGPSSCSLRPSGLFVLYASPTFLFRSRASGRWSRHTLPEKNCLPMQVDDQGEEVTVECGKVTYRSGNAGATWRGPET